MQDEEKPFSKIDFGSDFKWGISTSAYQIEGGWNEHGKGPSIWDEFSKGKGRIRSGHNGEISCDFYHHYKEDIDIINFLSIKCFRFSISWSRIFPDGKGNINPAGVDFYNRIINRCLVYGIEPWITLYHWDLPLALDKQGGWTNREIINWFASYVNICSNLFGDRVKHWIILNEPIVFTGTGYFLGAHAPGEKGLSNFLSATHHATLCQLIGGRIVKENVTDSEVGTSFSCSYIESLNNHRLNRHAAERMDLLLNRMSIEAVLGMGYPIHELTQFKYIEKFIHSEDEKFFNFQFDFIGLQNYTREVVKYSAFTPYIHSSFLKASKRNVSRTSMDWEVYPWSIYEMLKKFSHYSKVKKIYVTENGASFRDKVENGHVHDTERTHYLQRYIAQVLRARREGVNVQGYFVWTLLDNFEWAEGYNQRFGLVYVDFQRQCRIIKDSGYWYKSFMES